MPEPGAFGKRKIAFGAGATEVFQRLEKIFGGFPMIGKNFRDFSNDWKKIFQWLESALRAQ